MNIKWCEECEIEEAKYKYNDKIYCDDCLLFVLDKEDKIQSWTVTHYEIDGNYIGNDNDKDMEEVIEDIAEYFEIEKLESEE